MTRTPLAWAGCVGLDELEAVVEGVQVKSYAAP